MASKPKVKELKYPRIIVSNARHAKLRAEAAKRGNIPLSVVAEEKFIKADKKK